MLPELQQHSLERIAEFYDQGKDMSIDVVGTKRWDILENIRRMGC